MEAEFTADIVDLCLNQAVTILEDLLKPMVHIISLGICLHRCSCSCFLVPCTSDAKFRMQAQLIETAQLFIFQVESMDYYKNQQLRELAILNGTLREKTLI